MLTNKRMETIVGVSLFLLNGQTRGDCLDGHLENFFILASYQLSTSECFKSEIHGSILADSCDTFCCDKNGNCTFCPGASFSGSVSTSLTSVTIQVVCKVENIENNIGHTGQNVVVADIFVGLDVVGGEVSCVTTGRTERVIEGVTEVRTFGPQPGLSAGASCEVRGRFVEGTATSTTTVTCTPTVRSATRNWTNPAGGSYSDPANWTTNCAPAHDPPQRSDTALFNLPTATFIPVTGSGATAGEWLINNSMIDFQGSGELFSTITFRSALDIRNGGKLRLSAGGSLVTPRASIGQGGTTESTLEVLDSVGPGLSIPENLLIGRGLLEARSGGQIGAGRLAVGSSNGSGTVRVKQGGSRLHVLNGVSIGFSGQPGTVEVLDGGLFEVSQANVDPVVIGEAADGTVTVRGNDPPNGVSNPATFRTDRVLVVGQGARGTLNVEGGGDVRANTLVLPDIINSGSGIGEVRVDAQNGPASLTVPDAILVGATELVELEVRNGGFLETKKLVIGIAPIRPGAADVTIRGFGSLPSLLAVDDNGACCGLPTDVGVLAPGQLRILDGAVAEFDGGGLVIGSDAQGLVLVSGQNAPSGVSTEVVSSGEIKVGDGGPGIMQLEAGAKMTHTGELKIGLGAGLPSGLVSLVRSGLDVNGTLSVGPSGQGLLNIQEGSFVDCDTLLVGGSGSQSSGTILLTDLASLTINGNAQVGTAPGGFGSILLANDSAGLSINGTLTIGNPSGGPGGGNVALIDATIEGTGNIVVNPNGTLTGTGTVRVLIVRAGGHVDPGLSPGALTIDGDLELVSGGVLVMEYAGFNPGEFDVLHVTGQTTLGGRLEVHFRNGFTPADPAAFIQSQDFVEADGGIIGDYAERIYAFPDIFADFDDDGDKDLRDVASFQNCFGLSGSAVEPDCNRADWENNDLIDGIDVAELIPRLTNPQ